VVQHLTAAPLSGSKAIKLQIAARQILVFSR